MAYNLEMRSLDKPYKWTLLSGIYDDRDVAIKRAKKLIEVIPLIKVQIVDLIGDQGKVVWSNVN